MHNLEQASNGRTAFADSRSDAWHQLGQQLNGQFTAEQAMSAAHLGNWNVRKSPLYTMTEQGSVPVNGHYAIIRDNPFEEDQIDVLGNAGERYHVVQNEAHAQFLNTLVDEGGAHFDTAGSINGGKQVFLTMKLPSHISVGGVEGDKIDTYLAAVNSHDGSSSFQLMVTPIRVVCQNTLNIAMGSAQNVFRVRHTSGVAKAMGERARQALDLTFNYLDEFQKEAERLIETTMTESQFEDMIQKEFGAPKGAAAATITRAENRIDDLMWLFSDAATQENVRGTAWAGFNALTEWSDHYSPVRGEDEDARARRAVADPEFKNRALQIVKKAVKA